jgi:hypothetical protein
MASSTNNKRTRYVQGGTTEQFPNRLGWWERKIMPRSNTDIRLVITSDLVGRADAIAKLVYGSDQYMWVVLQYNTILDDREELIEGAVIYLPSPDRIL